MAGILGNVFDFDHDRKLDVFEKVAEILALDDLLREDSPEELITEFELSGLDAEELEFMDEDEQREALEDAVLDLEDYDF